LHGASHAFIPSSATNETVVYSQRKMEIFVLSLLAFAVAILTFFSGFGLGTILTPVFMIYFPVELAICLTGVVHFFNNVFKIILVGKKADKSVLINFGIPAVVAAFIGSILLFEISDQQPIAQYEIMDKSFAIYPIKLLISSILLVFASLELIPYFRNLQFARNKLPIGGLFSGFFGGLSGNQGALRSAFLVKAGLSKEAFIGTTVVVSTFVDFTRLGVYFSNFQKTDFSDNAALIICVTLSGIAGAYVGNKILKKVTLDFVQKTVAILLIILAIALGLGFI
jgi:uncharacterized protein